MSDAQRQVRRSYDAVAAEYAELLSNELEGKPLDRRLLDDVAARAAGPICDLGCGPGHVASYLHRRGGAVVGVDLAPAMIEQARRRHPGPRFEVGDLCALAHDDGSFGAAVALYSLIHFDDAQLRRAAQEIARILVPGGLLLAGFHRGSETIHRDELFGQRVDLDFRFHEPDRITAVLAEAGFTIERVVERDPYPGVEVETRRFYVLAATSKERTDWVGWHEPYADPQSPLSHRLEVVQRHVRGFLDGCSSAAPRAVSLCAGDGRDLLDVLAGHPRGRQVRARLVELDPALAARARARALAAKLDQVEVTCADAAVTDVYADAVPAELVLVCGVFGNIGDRHVERTIRELPQLCARGATVVWTRHRRHPDLTPGIRRWFAAAGFREQAFDSPGPGRWSVGAHSFVGDPQPLAPGARLFSFVR